MHRLYRLTKSSLFARNFCAVSSQTTVASQAYLAGWPGKYRLLINSNIKTLIDEPYLSKVKAYYIEKTTWMEYGRLFRRKLVKEPIVALAGNELDFIEFCQKLDKILELQSQIESTMPSSIPSSSLSIEVLQEELQQRQQQIVDFCYDVMIKSACIDLKDVIQSYKTIIDISDLTHPHKWYPFARIIKRRIIFHGGPTNSGKTYEALQRLRHADPSKGGGIYCGPLRLLALEVYEKLNREGAYTNLLTGQERQQVPMATHTSCTIEMVNLNKVYDVAVVDEIQMIGDPDRGSAWTRVVLGLHANEIHLCGGLEAFNIVRSLCETTGDDFELKEYQRLSALRVSDESLKGDYGKVQKGDCIVAFSKADIYSIRHAIESLTKFRCAVIYGQLPPETRSEQARQFNDENGGYDILIASDAIGMGLNLNIKRVVFHTTIKAGAPGSKSFYVEPSQVKQIGGRAGRKSSKFPYGEVTAWQEVDLAYIRAVMNNDVPQIEAAGIFPSLSQIELFSQNLLKHMAKNKKSEEEEAGGVNDRESVGKPDEAHSIDELELDGILNADATSTSMPEAKVASVLDEDDEISPIVTEYVQDGSSSGTGTSSVTLGSYGRRPVCPTSSIRLGTLLSKFMSIAQLDQKYFLCNHVVMTTVSNWLQTIPLSLEDRFQFANAPVKLNNNDCMKLLYIYAAAYAQGKPVALNVRLSHRQPRGIDEMEDVCNKHSLFELYLWLSLRFPQYFIERDNCVAQKHHALGLIQATLKSSHFTQSHSHSATYEKLRTSARTWLPDDLPPLQYGRQIREDTSQYLKAVTKASHVLFPRKHEELNPSRNRHAQQHHDKHHVAGVKSASHVGVANSQMSKHTMHGSLHSVGGRRIYVPRAQQAHAAATATPDDNAKDHSKFSRTKRQDVPVGDQNGSPISTPRTSTNHNRSQKSYPQQRTSKESSASYFRANVQAKKSASKSVDDARKNQVASPAVLPNAKHTPTIVAAQKEVA